MFAPWPTNRLVVLVLLACLTGSSAPSTATVVVRPYLPFAAVQVPIVTFADAPTASEPLYDPVSVFTVAPLLSFSTAVTACAPLAEAMVPWFLMVVVKVTVLPDDGVPGDQLVLATRSELCSGWTARFVPLVKELLASFSSTTVLASSTFAVTG